ncbi:unnamed protein product [Pleuronectes platessa]|uniref:Uncharacterized protein n=1 Tax=Pleuronectes platessa TaxID=8262 RepID=A0A9N7TGY2_PLEPL|nr:unnamed protein product [Pleuronectes platessa]
MEEKPSLTRVHHWGHARPPAGPSAARQPDCSLPSSDTCQSTGCDVCSQTHKLCVRSSDLIRFLCSSRDRSLHETSFGTGAQTVSRCHCVDTDIRRRRTLLLHDEAPLTSVTGTDARVWAGSGVSVPNRPGDSGLW